MLIIMAMVMFSLPVLARGGSPPNAHIEKQTINYQSADTTVAAATARDVGLSTRELTAASVGNINPYILTEGRSRNGTRGHTNVAGMDYQNYYGVTRGPQPPLRR